MPWTAPGEPLCCCEGNCYTDLANDPVSPYAANTWQEITSAEYTSLLAGGTFSCLVNANVTGANTTFSETHVVSNAVVGLAIAQSIEGGCYERHTGSVTIQRTNSTSPLNFDYTSSVNFMRSLATYSGKRYVSLASVEPPSSAPSVLSLSGLNAVTFGINVSAYVGDFSSFTAGLCRGAGVSFAHSLIIGSNSYAISGTTIACFATSTSMGFISHSGSISVAATFTPSAP